MKPSAALREYLERHFHATLEAESGCSCGHENHVCAHFFRVDGRVVAAVVPESRALSPSDLAEALGGSRVERLTSVEPEAAPRDVEASHLRTSEKLATAAVYLDEVLAGQTELVFCPRMFFGEQAQCFHVPTQQFLDLTHGRVLPLTSAGVTTADDWAV
jgi:hypothetical protein